MYHKTLVSSTFRGLLLGAILLAALLTTSTFFTQRVHAAQSVTPIGAMIIFPDGHKVISHTIVRPQAHARPLATSPGSCISAGGSGNVTYQDSNWLDFNANSWIVNDCGAVLRSGTNWSVEVYANCSGEVFDTGGNDGSLASSTSPGELVSLQYQYPYQTTCVYADFSQRAPDYDQVDITASGGVVGYTGLATGYGDYTV